MVTESKRYHPTKFTRFVLYPLFLLIFIISISVIIILANGYKFNFSGNRVSLQKTGMIIVNSRPIDGQIFLNNKYINKKTTFTFLPVKISGLLPIEHLVTIKKDGFRTWSKKVEVKPNLVTWLNYILLFPEKLDIKTVDNLAGKTILSESKNRRFLFVSGSEEGVKAFYAYDSSNGNLSKIWPKTFVPTETWLKQLEIVSAEFNQNNDKILLKVKNGSGFDYAIMDSRADGKIYSLSGLKLSNINKIQWSANNSDEIFILAGKSLYNIDANQPKQVSPIATDIVDFSSEKNRKIYYVKSTSANLASLNIMNPDGSSKEILYDTVVSDSAYKFSYSPQEESLALLPVNNKILTLYYRVDGKLTTIQLSKDISDFAWSHDGSMIYYRNNREVKRYDLDKKEENHIVLPADILQLDWYYDEFHYIVRTSKELFVIDFDNTNKVVISESGVTSFFPDQKMSSFIFVEKGKNLKYSSAF